MNTRISLLFALFVAFSCSRTEIIESPIDKSVAQIQKLLQTHSSDPNLKSLAEQVIYDNGIKGQLEPRLFVLMKEIFQSRELKQSQSPVIGRVAYGGWCDAPAVSVRLVSNGSGWCFIYQLDNGATSNSCWSSNYTWLGETCDSGIE